MSTNECEIRADAMRSLLAALARGGEMTDHWIEEIGITARALQQASAEIERLTQANERLLGQRDEARRNAKRMRGRVQEAEANMRAAVRASVRKDCEVERLRGLLKEAKHCVGWCQRHLDGSLEMRITDALRGEEE